MYFCKLDHSIIVNHGALKWPKAVFLVVFYPSMNELCDVDQ